MPEEFNFDAIQEEILFPSVTIDDEYDSENDDYDYEESDADEDDTYGD